MFRNPRITGGQRRGWSSLGGLQGRLAGSLGVGHASAPAHTLAAPVPPPSRRGARTFEARTR
jgi:hypothetical protein